MKVSKGKPWIIFLRLLSVLDFVYLCVPLNFQTLFSFFYSYPYVIIVSLSSSLFTQEVFIHASDGMDLEEFKGWLFVM